MPRLSEETKNARRRQIIDAARRCFTRHGFAGTSMQDIIAESGLSAGSIYSHFSGKDDILRQAAEVVLSFAEASLSEQHPHGIPAPRDVALLIKAEILPERFMDMFLQFWAEAPRNPELAELVQGNLQRVRTLLEDTLTPWAAQNSSSTEDAQILARFYADALMALVHGYFVRLSVDPGVKESGLFDQLITLLPEH